VEVLKANLLSVVALEVVKVYLDSEVHQELNLHWPYRDEGNYVVAPFALDAEQGIV
jgi:hypothetical protein